MKPTEKVQNAYEYVNVQMIGNDAFTDSTIRETLSLIDLAYWRLSRSERKSIVGR